MDHYLVADGLRCAAAKAEIFDEHLVDGYRWVYDLELMEHYVVLPGLFINIHSIEAIDEKLARLDVGWFLSGIGIYQGQPALMF